MAENGHAVQVGDVCPAHTELVENLSSICANLKLMIQLGFVVIPFLVAFGAYLTMQIMDLKSTVAVTSYKVERLCIELDSLKKK